MATSMLLEMGAQLIEPAINDDGSTFQFGSEAHELLACAQCTVLSTLYLNWVPIIVSTADFTALYFVPV